MAEYGTEVSPVIGIIGDGAYIADSPTTLFLKQTSRLGFRFSVEDIDGCRVFSVLRMNFHRLVLVDSRKVIGGLDISFPRHGDRAILRPDESKLFDIRVKQYVPSYTTELELFMKGEEYVPSVIAQFKQGPHEDMHVICTRTKREIARIHYYPGGDTLAIMVPTGGDYALASFIALVAHGESTWRKVQPRSRRSLGPMEMMRGSRTHRRRSSLGIRQGLGFMFR